MIIFGNGGNEKGFSASIVYQPGKSLGKGNYEAPAYYLVVDADLSGIQHAGSSPATSTQIQEYASMLGANGFSGSQATWTHLPYQGIPNMQSKVNEAAMYSHDFTLEESTSTSHAHNCIP